MKFTDWPGLDYVSTLEAEADGGSPRWAISEQDEEKDGSQEEKMIMLLPEKSQQ